MASAALTGGLVAASVEDVRQPAEELRAPQTGSTVGNAAAADPERLRLLAELHELMTTSPSLPVAVLRAVRDILASASKPMPTEVDARTQPQSSITKPMAPSNVRGDKIAALQAAFEAQTLRDTPSQFELTMLGVRPTKAFDGLGTVEDTTAAPATEDGETEVHLTAKERYERSVDAKERLSAKSHSKRFHFEPGGHKAGERGHLQTGQPFMNGFASYKLAEADRGRKIAGPRARLGGYFHHPDRRYDMRHHPEVGQHPLNEGHAWHWSVPDRRFVAPENLY